jgi:hypothetical protein
MVIWNLVVAAWLKKVQPNATSLFYYIGYAVLTLLQMMSGGFASMTTMMHPGVHVSTTHFLPGLIWTLAWVVKLVARFMQRASLQEHFNTVEPVGLDLNPVMVFFFGGIYFQYHLNKINEMKQAARFGTQPPFDR